MKCNNIMSQPLKIIGMLVAILTVIGMSGTSHAVRSEGSAHASPRGPIKGDSEKRNLQSHAQVAKGALKGATKKEDEAVLESQELKGEQVDLKDKMEALDDAIVKTTSDLNEDPENQNAKEQLETLNKQREELQRQKEAAEQNLQYERQKNTIFDDALMQELLDNTNESYDAIIESFDYLHAEYVAQAFLNLYSRLPYHGTLLQREDTGGDSAVPLLRKNVEFSKGPVFAGKLDQSPSALPVIGIRFRVEFNGEVCGVNGSDFGGYFHVAATQGTPDRSNLWKVTLSEKDVFQAGNNKVINKCLKRNPLNETWGDYFYSFFTPGYETAFSSNRVPVNGVTQYSGLRGDLTIPQMETILLLVRYREVNFHHPYEEPYKLVLDMTPEEHGKLLNQLESVGRDEQ